MGITLGSLSAFHTQIVPGWDITRAPSVVWKLSILMDLVIVWRSMPLCRVLLAAKQIFNISICSGNMANICLSRDFCETWLNLRVTNFNIGVIMQFIKSISVQLGSRLKMQSLGPNGGVLGKWRALFVCLWVVMSTFQHYQQ